MRCNGWQLHAPALAQSSTGAIDSRLLPGPTVTNKAKKASIHYGHGAGILDIPFWRLLESTAYDPIHAHEAPAKEIAEQAQASLRDGDELCPIMDRIARAPAGHEEEHVYRALFGTELMVNIPTTFIDLGHPSLVQFPVFRPTDIIETLAARGKVDRILGVPLGSCNLPQQAYLFY